MNTPYRKLRQESAAEQERAGAFRAGAPSTSAGHPGIGPAASVVPRLDKGTHSDRLAMVVRVYDFGQDVIEASFAPRVRCEPKRNKRGAGVDREGNEDRAARRAVTTVRRKCMAMGADRLLTLTYRENVRDYDRASADLSKFLRLARQAFGEFPYVAVAERQKRGAVHWHLAIRGFRSVKTLRALWLRVVGDGNVDVAYRARQGQHDDCLQIGRYLAKYLAKGYGDENLGGLNRKRFRCSKGIKIPVERYEFASLDETNAFLSTVCESWGHFWTSEDELYGWASSW